MASYTARSVRLSKALVASSRISTSGFRKIARAMATEAKLLLLDEPTAGMNPRETQEMTELIGRLRDERGFTILFIEHDMRVVKGVSDRVVVIDYGRQIAEGSYAEISQDERVLEAYLGRKTKDAA